MKRTTVFLLLSALAASLIFSGCVSTSSPAQLRPLDSAAIEAAIATGKTKKQVKAALGPPHDNYKGEQWSYIFQGRDNNTYCLDLLFGHQDRIILARSRPYQGKTQ